jgi:O-antigen/teichoic acid export membrane protein
MQKQLFTTTILYSLLVFLQPLVSLLLQPYYLAHFSDYEYGVFSLMASFTHLVQFVGALSIGHSVFTFYYDYSDKPEQLKTYLGQVLSFTLYSVSIVVLLAYFLGDTFFYYFFKDDQLSFYPYGWLALISGLGYTFIVPFTSYLRNEKAIRWYTLLVMVNVLLSFLAQIWFIGYYNLGVVGALGGKALGVLASVALVLFANRKYLQVRLQFSTYLQGPFRFIRYDLPNKLVQWAYLFIDRFIVERLLSVSLVGVYSLLNVAVSTVDMAAAAFRSAILPFLYEAFKDEENDKTSEARVQLLYDFYIFLVVLAISGIVFLVGHLHYIVSKASFLGIQQYVSIYVLGYLFSSITDMVYLEFLYHKNAKRVLYYTLSVLVLLCLFSISFIGKFALWGIVYALVLAKFLNVIIVCITFPTLLQRLSSLKIKVFLAYCLVSNLSTHFIFIPYQYVNYAQAGFFQLSIFVLIALWIEPRIIQKVLSYTKQ